MKKIKKLLIVLVLIIVVAIAIIIGLYINGKKKTQFVVEAGNAMFEFNKELSSSDNVHSKTTYDSGYFEDFVYGKTSKTIQYDDGIKITRVFIDDKVYEYKEKDNSNEKIMCITSDEYESDDYEYSSDEYDFTDSPLYKQSIAEKVSNFFSTISYGIHTRISTGVEDNKDCYIITTSESSDSKNIQYIDKTTKVTYKTVSSYDNTTITTTYEYDFGSVTAKDVENLKQSQYKMLDEEDFEFYEFK